MAEFLHFLNAHNIAIVEILFGIVMVFGVLEIFRIYRSKEQTSESPSHASEVTDSIVKLIEEKLSPLKNLVGAQPAPAQAGVSPAAPGPAVPDPGLTVAPAAAAAPVTVSEPVANSAVDTTSTELQKIKDELEVKKKEVEELKIQVSNAPTVVAANGSAQLTVGDAKMIENLQARLTEYEIISEDLADLSRLKEENANLKKQLQSGESAPAPVAEIIPEPAEAPPLEAAPLVDELELAAALAEVPLPPPSSETTEPAQVDAISEDDIKALEESLKKSDAA